MSSAASQTNAPQPKATTPRRTPTRKKSASSNKSVPPQSPELQPPASPHSPSPIAALPNKQSQLIGLLQQPAGATLIELMHATGWQAHSLRGVISGVLRKKLGLVVVLSRNETGERRYRIQATHAEARGHASVAVVA